jgi:hypothetical protein
LQIRANHRRRKQIRAGPPRIHRRSAGNGEKPAVIREEDGRGEVAARQNFLEQQRAAVAARLVVDSGRGWTMAV